MMTPEQRLAHSRRSRRLAREKREAEARMTDEDKALRAEKLRASQERAAIARAEAAVAALANPNTGSRNPGSKLGVHDVLAIRARAANGESQADLSRDFGVSSAHINHIVKGRRWSHV